MGLLDSISDAMRRGFQESAQRDEYVREMSRGFDLFPVSHKLKHNGAFALGRLGHIIVGILFFGGVYFALDYTGTMEKYKIGGIVILIIPAYYLLRNVILFLRFSLGAYDFFGGYVLKKSSVTVTDSRYRYSNGRLKSEYRGDGHRNLPRDRRSPTKAGYDEHYYANVNGVECRISKSQYMSLKLDGYYYIARIKGKYQNTDEFFFIMTNSGAGDQRTGNHFPSDENRRKEPPRSNALANFSLALGILGFVMGILMYKLTHGIPTAEGDKLQLMFIILFGSGGFFTLLGLLGNRKRK